MNTFVFAEPDLENPCKSLIQTHLDHITFETTNIELKDINIEKNFTLWKCCYHGTWFGNCRKCIMYMFIWIGKQKEELQLVNDMYRAIFDLLPRVKRQYCSRCCIHSNIRSFRPGDERGKVFPSYIVPISTYLFCERKGIKERKERVYLMGQYEDEILIEDITKFEDIKCYFIKKDLVYDKEDKIWIREYLSLEEVKQKFLPTQSLKNIVICDECMFHLLLTGDISP